MRIPQTHNQRIKAGIHAAQSLLIFVAGCLSLAVLTKNGGNGRLGYFFGLCFLTIPALIYLVMVPMWTRAWRFANVYAYATLDITFTLLWFAAFISVASWDSSGSHKGESVSKASVGFGVIICLLFVGTSVLSVQGVMAYRKTGIMPNGNTRTHGRAELLQNDEDKDAWNTNTDELNPEHPSHDNSFNDPMDERRAYGQLPQQDEQTGFGPFNHDRLAPRNGSHDGHSISETGEAHPGREVSYGSSSNLSVVTPRYDEELAPSAFSPTGVPQTPGGRVNFPQGNYESAFR